MLQEIVSFLMKNLDSTSNESTIKHLSDFIIKFASEKSQNNQKLDLRKVLPKIKEIFLAKLSKPTSAMKPNRGFSGLP